MQVGAQHDINTIPMSDRSRVVPFSNPAINGLMMHYDDSIEYTSIVSIVFCLLNLFLLMKTKYNSSLLARELQTQCSVHWV